MRIRHPLWHTSQASNAIFLFFPLLWFSHWSCQSCKASQKVDESPLSPAISRPHPLRIPLPRSPCKPIGARTQIHSLFVLFRRLQQARRRWMRRRLRRGLGRRLGLRGQHGTSEDRGWRRRAPWRRGRLRSRLGLRRHRLRLGRGRRLILRQPRSPALRGSPLLPLVPVLRLPARLPVGLPLLRLPVVPLTPRLPALFSLLPIPVPLGGAPSLLSPRVPCLVLPMALALPILAVGPSFLAPVLLPPILPILLRLLPALGHLSSF